MRLPAPALACGCSACTRSLNTAFADIVRANYTPDEMSELLNISVPVPLGSIRERIAEYSQRHGKEY